MMPAFSVNTLRELIDEIARARAEAVFLLDPENGNTLNFRDLQHRATVLFKTFEQEELEPGDKVAFLMDNGLFTAQLFLGTMYAGFVTVPLNVHAGVVQLSYMLDHCDAKVVFVDAGYDRLIREALCSVPRTIRIVHAGVEGDLRISDRKSPAVVPNLPTPDDVAMLMYSSGSTGKPKAAVHTHRSILAGARNSVCAHQLSEADRSLLVLPLYHINAECVTLIPTLLSGGSVAVPRRFSVNRFWDWIDNYRCTWSALVPTIISELVDWDDPLMERRQAAFERIRFLRSSSAPLSPLLHRRFLDKFNLPLLQAMGSTEAGNVFSNPLPPGRNKIGSPGLPWGFEARVVDRQGVEVSSGESGEVLLRGAALMKGYYKDPEGTAAVLDQDGWLHTGDLAYRDEDGYFFVVGRSKELVIKGGVNIAPRQIDEVLESCPGVLEAAAVGIPDHYLGEDLIAFVVLRAETAISENDLLSFCEARLGHFKTPSRIHFVNELPKGPSGKVQRLRLLDQVAPTTAKSIGQDGDAAESNGSDHTNVGEGSSNEAFSLESVIASAWAKALSLPEVDTETNFFALGGHSLIAIQCLSVLRDKLPVALSLSDFFEHSTVVRQAEVVKQRLGRQSSRDKRVTNPSQDQRPPARSSRPAAVPLRDRNLPCPLSPAQERLWFLEQLNPGVPVYNESEVARLRGELNVGALERALNEIVTRHDALRTTVCVADWMPYAVVHPAWPLELKRIDLSVLSEIDREAEIDRFLVDEPRIPYHLETQPGIRATLLQLGSQDHVFILMMHHIICDWASEGIIWRELSALYRSLIKGEPVVLPRLPVQFEDYAVWCRKLSERSDFARDLAYWEENLLGAPALLELPADRPRPATLSHRGARLRWKISTTLTERLRAMSSRESTSLFTIFTAAWNILLYRYAAQDDILLGIPLADRDEPELAGVVGFLLHVQVLRTRLAGNMTFRELLAGVQKSVLDLYAHRSVPFDRVVQKLGPGRNPSYSPLFQVMLNWRDRDQMLSFIGLDGLAVESLLSESGTSKFDMLLFATDVGDEVWLELEYSTDLFDQGRIQRMLAHYENVLQAVSDAPEKRLAEVPLLSPAERQQVLIDWNRTELSYPRACLHRLIEEQATRTPEAVAVVFEHDRITYRRLNERANQLARCLQNKGVGRNVLVGVCMRRSAEMVVGLLAILKAGGAYVPLDPAYPKPRRDFIIQDAQVFLVLTEEPLRRLMVDCNARVVYVDTESPAIAVAETDDLGGAACPEDLAYVIYTSGSTGQPKGVAISHRSPTAFVHWAHSVFSPEEMAGVLFATSICFDLSVFEMFATLTCGGKIIVAENALCLRDIPAVEEITLINTVPSVMKELMRQGALPASVRTVNLAGEPLRTELVNEIYEVPHIRKLYDLYGPSETTTYSTFSLRQAGGPCTIGKPIANTRVYIVDPCQQPVPVGVTGELYIGGDGLALGYLNRPELTATRFITHSFGHALGERIYRTGDLARYLPDGNIEFLGRMDYQVKIRGFRIELGEIEASLKQHPDVDECVVLVQGEDPDKRLIAYVAAGKSRYEVRIPQLRGMLNERLPDYMVPAEFVMLESLPVTPNGKIDRKALSLLDSTPARRSGGGEPVAPHTPVELHLKEIWARMLGTQNIGVRDNFFEIGGHSLLAVHLISEINRSLEVNFPVPAFVRDPTIAGIEAYLQQEDQLNGQPKLMTLRRSDKGAGELFFLAPGVAECRLAHLVQTEYDIFATWVPLSPSTLKAATLNTIDDLPPLEEMAAPHAELIRNRRISGPCLIAGYSFNGLLAFEVAHQIQRQGQHVDVVVLLDTPAVLPHWWEKFGRFSFTEKRGLIRRFSTRLTRKERDKPSDLETVSAAPHGLQSMSNPVLDRTPSVGSVPWEIERRIYSNARERYQLRTLESSAVLFRTEEHSRGWRSKFLDNTLGWADLFTFGVKVVDLQGDHLSFLRESHAKLFAQRFGESLPGLWGTTAQGHKQEFRAGA